MEPEASGRILAVSHKSIVDLTIMTNGEWKSDNIVNNEDCDISASPVRGCYNCLTGAQLTLSCHSKYPTMMKVVCTDHMFSAACDRFITQTEATLHSIAAQFVDQCKVTCGRKVYVFNITGTLAYYPHMEVVRWYDSSTTPKKRRTSTCTTNRI
ncbi:hypothetical protein Y032_0033g2690 [Ancylostoma ceylanicum]|uniref:Phlebovirus glycoprotein G2 fusion domain-containing protein n=1 Tax=Ancylostoma ceylanicum TaxID=53326 RepID=A0A016UNP4_9BILA|nr:hypothetical protein Y032_0033g2690 [Ancylostoma ceylanicum]